MRKPRFSERGLSLMETLIATAIAGSVMVGLASLVSAAMMQSKNQGQTTSQATALAAQKIDQLMTLQFTAASTAAPLTCAASPCGSITADTTNYVEYLDATGNVLAGATAATIGVFFTRRWMITNSTATTKLIEVVVIGTAVVQKNQPSVNMACIKAQQ